MNSSPTTSHPHVRLRFRGAPRFVLHRMAAAPTGRGVGYCSYPKPNRFVFVMSLPSILQLQPTSKPSWTYESERTNTPSLTGFLGLAWLAQCVSSHQHQSQQQSQLQSKLDACFEIMAGVVGTAGDEPGWASQSALGKRAKLSFSR